MIKVILSWIAFFIFGIIVTTPFLIIIVIIIGAGAGAAQADWMSDGFIIGLMLTPILFAVAIASYLTYRGNQANRKACSSATLSSPSSSVPSSGEVPSQP